MIDVVCGVIRNNRGEVLLCQRPLEKSQGGLWEFPGGKIEEGECAADALARELLEELDCVVQVGSALTPVEHHYETISIRLIPLYCNVLERDPRAIEHYAIQWVAPHELIEFTLAPADIPIAKEVFERS